MKKIYILHFDLSYYPEEDWIRVVSAYDLDEAKNMVLENENAPPNKAGWTMETLDDMLSNWVEIPVQISKQGTYFPKPVTSVKMGDKFNPVKVIEILYNKRDIV